MADLEGYSFLEDLADSDHQPGDSIRFSVEGNQSLTDNSLSIPKETVTRTESKGDENKENEENDNEEIGNKRQRHESISNINKKRRLAGESYMGKIYTKDASGKKSTYVQRDAVKLLPRCSGKMCSNDKNSVFCCSSVSEEKRNIIFTQFWSNTDWNQRRTYVCSLVDVVAKQTITEGSRRSCSLRYFLKVGEGSDDRVRVCATMFENTFAIPHRTILSWISKSTHGLPSTAPKSDDQQRTNGQYAVSIQKTNLAGEFIDKLDKVPSHYCRSSTQKLYVWPNDFKSAADIHGKYVKWVENQSNIEDNMKIPLSLTSFKTLLKKKNISVFQPRKDQCDLCISYKQGNLSEAEYTSHQDSKNNARHEKEKDKERAINSNGEMLLITVDVQAVQTVPKTKASCLYFRTKLNLHNYTVFDNVSHDTLCYVWTEVNGGLTANVFTSCLIHYLDEQVNKNTNIKTITIWSDGCGAQNRNSTLISSIATWSQAHKVTVFFKYLEKGHTQMEVDSVHSKIETYQKNLDLSVPADYCTAIQKARKSPFPYRYNHLDYSFFKNYEAIQTVSSVRPGQGKGDPCITDVKQYRCNADGDIHYKLSHNFDDNFQLLPKRRKSSNNLSPDPLYKAQIPITLKKYNDLQIIKKVLHSDYHQFYDKLPHA